MKSKVFVGEDDLDLEEQICTWLALNPEVRVLGKSPVERIQPRSAPWSTALRAVDYEVSVHSHVRHFQVQASKNVAREQALISGFSGQGRRHGR